MYACACLGGRLGAITCLWAVVGYGRDVVYSTAWYMAKKDLKVPNILIFFVKRGFH